MDFTIQPEIVVYDGPDDSPVLTDGQTAAVDFGTTPVARR